ncbi:TlpA family protein disulfide reductase [Galbibacter sp.]|uniref:TlpA family protein disulfide reductase n=1 Tax=Galbibacter sp. TaxID=2918471 RepID=UPI003A92B525
MKLNKSQIQNILLLVGILVLLFTPLGTQIKVQLNRLLAFSPSVVAEDHRSKVTTYQWDLQNLEGNRYSFKDTQGKVVLLNFWATWCPPCIAEMPSMQELYNDYGDQIVFVFVSQEPKEKIQGFLDKHNYNFPVYQAISEPPAAFNHKSIPQTYLVDKAGNIVIDKNGAANWNSKSVRQTITTLLNL